MTSILASVKPFRSLLSQKCAFLRTVATCVCVRNIEYSLSVWRHLTFKNACALLEVVGRALEVALK